MALGSSETAKSSGEVAALSAARGALVALFAALALVTQASPAVSSTGNNASRIWRGNGAETLPPISVTTPSTLLWANNGGVFQIFPAGGSNNGSVNSQGTQGWTYLPPGRYTLQINAIGSWEIEVEPGVIFPHKLAGGWLEYAGAGGMELPPFNLPRSESVYWTATGGIFQIFSGGFSGIEVNSQASSGSTYAAGGAQDLQINTTGRWTLKWKS